MEWLTREQIDQVLEQLSADDVIEATEASGNKAGAKVAGLAFHYGALRILGPIEGRWTQRVKATDLTYFANRIGEAINMDSPLSVSVPAPPALQEPGEDSPPQTSDGSPPQTT